MAEISLEKKDSNKDIETNSFQEKNNSNEKRRKFSIDSSKSESFFSNLNTEIKLFIENEADISFSSNSNSESNDPQINIDNLLDSKYWRINKDLSIENENKNEKDNFVKKKNIFLLNVDEKESTKLFESKNEYKGDKVMISEGSNKQSTQGNEDEETRIEHLHNTSDSDSNNNSPLNSLSNNESSENDINCDKLIRDINNCDKLSSYKDEEKKNNNNLDNNLSKDKDAKSTKDNKNLFNSNLLLNGFNFNTEKLKLNESDFVFPYEPVQNQNKNNFSTFFPGAYLNQPICNFNLPSPLSTRSILSFNSNSSNKLNNNYSQNNEDDYIINKENKLNINGQNNKFINSNANNYNKKLNQNQKDIIDLPIIINQNNNQNLPLNFNYSKLNLNMTYYPKIQNSHISTHKQSLDKINNSSNYLPHLNNNSFANLSNNLSEKKAKNNNLNLDEQNNTTNNININFNNMIYNKMKINYKNVATNKNMNNAANKSSLKGEKQILNLDDIVSGKDTRTTVMIRNIPIKYTDEILNEALVEFHGKYDCLYMPYDYEKNGNKGYAFINFVNPLHILYFYEKFNGKKWLHFESSKICELNCAHFQGINEIQKHAKNFKDLKKTSYYSDKEENMVIPSKYLFKLKKRFPKMQYTENKTKKILVIKSFE
jgi:hypothetical protein